MTLTVSYPYVLFATTVILILMQSLVDKWRMIRLPDKDRIASIDNDLKDAPALHSSRFTPIPTVDGRSPLITDGRYALMFLYQHDLIWTARAAIIINAVLGGFLIHWFITHGFHVILFNILVMLALFQIWFWVYCARTPVKCLLFDRKLGAVYIPAYMDNDAVFAPFQSLAIHGERTWFGKRFVVVSKKLKIKRHIHFYSSGDVLEPTQFTVYHRPFKPFMLYHYHDCAQHIANVAPFMESNDSTPSNPGLHETGLLDYIHTQNKADAFQRLLSSA